MVLVFRNRSFRWFEFRVRQWGLLAAWGVVGRVVLVGQLRLRVVTGVLWLWVGGG